MNTIGPAPQTDGPLPAEPDATRREDARGQESVGPPALTGPGRAVVVALGYAVALLAAAHMVAGTADGGPRLFIMAIPALLAVGLAPWFPRWCLLAVLGSAAAALAGGIVLVQRSNSTFAWWLMLGVALFLSVCTGPRRRKDAAWTLATALAAVLMVVLASTVVVQAITTAQGEPFFTTSEADPSGATQTFEQYDENGQPSSVTVPLTHERPQTPLEVLGQYAGEGAITLGGSMAIAICGAFFLRTALTSRRRVTSADVTSDVGDQTPDRRGPIMAVASLGGLLVACALLLQGGSGTVTLGLALALVCLAGLVWAWQSGALHRSAWLASWRLLLSISLGGLGVLTFIGSIGPLSYGSWLVGMGAELLVLGMLIVTIALALTPFHPRLAYWLGIVAAAAWLAVGLLQPIHSAAAAVWLFLLFASSVLVFLPARRAWFGYAAALTVVGTAFFTPFIAATSGWSNSSYGGSQYGSFGGPAGLLFGAGQAFVVFVLPPLIAWAIRAGLRSRAERAQLKAAQLRLEESRKELAQSEEARALSDDRRAIAGDVHDVLAHSLTVIVAQGQGALVVDGAARERAVRNMVEVARSSLLDVRALIERLDGEDSDRPSPGLDDLSALVDTFRQAGLSVALNELGDRGSMPGTSQLAVYRIVQESLTNALKHAERGSRCLVSLDWRGDDPGLSLTVSSSGFAETPAEGTGMGLTGMRTRGAMAGGWLTAGRSDDAQPGWLVTAYLPVTENHTEVLR